MEVKGSELPIPLSGLCERTTTHGSLILCDLFQSLEFGVLSQIFPKLISGFYCLSVGGLIGTYLSFCPV